MGASASIRPEIFAQVKELYEQKKNEGLSDEELFNVIKNYIDTANEAADKPEAAAAPVEEPSETVTSATTEAAPAEGGASGEAAVPTPQVFAA